MCRRRTDVLLFLHPLVTFKHVLLLPGGLVGLGVVSLVPGLYLQALGSGRDHAPLLLRKECNLLLLYLPLLLLDLLLLQELDLRIDIGNGIARAVLRRHHVRRYGWVHGGSRQGRHLGVHRCRHEDRSIGAGHGRIECLALHDLLCPILILKTKVELQPVPEAPHAIHVKELLHIVISTMVHAVVLFVPRSRVHHDCLERRVPGRGNDGRLVGRRTGRMPCRAAPRRAVPSDTQMAGPVAQRWTRVATRNASRVERKASSMCRFVPGAGKPPRHSAVEVVDASEGQNVRDWCGGLNTASEAAYLIGRAVCAC